MFEKLACGSVWLLSIVPWWLVFIGIAFLSTGMVLLLRIVFEGKCYDRARSSTPGDLFLVGYCATMAYHFQTIGIPVFDTHLYAVWHLLVLTITMIVAPLLHISAIRRGGAERKFTLLPAQWWHNLIVVPLFAYTIISTLPLFLLFEDDWLLFGALMCLVAWAELLHWDKKHNRLVQISE